MFWEVKVILFFGPEDFKVEMLPDVEARGEGANKRDLVTKTATLHQPHNCLRL